MALRERRKFLKKLFEENTQRFWNAQSSIVGQNLNENSSEQILDYVAEHIEIAEIDEHHTADNNNGPMHTDNNDNNRLAENVNLVIYKNSIDTVGRVLEDFNILKEIGLLEDNLSLNLYVGDGNVLIHPKIPITKTQFAEGFNEYCEQSNTTMKDRRLLANFLHNSVGGVINLPIKEKRKAEVLNDNDDDGWETDSSNDVEKKDSRFSSLNLLNDTAIDDTSRYVNKQSRFFAFDQCDNDCTVFLGKNKRLFHCPTCKKPRFRVCSKRNCKSKGGDTCAHLLISGNSFKKLYYRPIIILIQDLLANPKFEYYLNYERLHNRRHNSQHLSDFMDGELARAHLNDMQKYGTDWIANDPDNRGDYILINLLLSEFYDSGQLFKSYVFDFWPLCIGILNMPPHLRGKVGVSYFLGALYTGKHTEAERIMFNDLVCEELRCLYEGITHEINGKKYLIQARLVMHILDTKAAEPVMGYQSNANSNFGCSNCGGVTGIHIGNQCVFLGNRNYLPQLNVLRFFGQTGKCCPSGFYNHEEKRQWYVEEHFHHLDIPRGSYETFFADRWQIVGKVIEKTKAATKGKDISSEQQRKLVNKILSEQQIQSDIDEVFTPCDGNDETKSTIVNFFFHGNKQYQWFHTGEFSFDETFALFGEYLYYRHQDYRTEKPYCRVTYDEYLQYAQQAEHLNSTKAQKKKSVHGIQGLWYWARLQYADIETQFTWPLVHAISGVVVKILKLITNDHYHKGKESTIVFLKLNKVRMPKKKKNRQIEERNSEDEEGGHDYEDSENDEEVDGFSIDEKKRFRPPYLKRKAPYQVFSKSNIDYVQACLDCVLLPTALSDDWNVSLTSPSSMKISQKIRMLLCYWDFVMESLAINQAYKKLFRMLAHDMTRLLSFRIDKSEVNNLLYSVIETNGTWEGMMPTESNSFQLHELVDLPLSFKYYGPPRFVSELPGEQMMRIMKDWKLKSNMGGNSSFLRTVVRKQIHYEFQKMKTSYSTRNDSHFTRRSKTNQLIYNELPFELHNPEEPSQMAKLSEREVEELCITLYAEVTRKFGENQRECEKSAVYRIRNHNTISHLKWIDKLKYYANKSNSSKLNAVDVDEARNLLNCMAKLNEFEVVELCITLYAEVTRKFGENNRECEKSAVYRIFANEDISNKPWIDKLKYYVDDSNSSKLNAVDVEVARNLLNFQPDFHRKALVYGTKFYSRGSHCRETKMWQPYVPDGPYGHEGYSPTNKNAWKWFEKAHYRSWCKFQCPDCPARYGLINAFFSVNAIGDEVLKNLLIASMTSFDFKSNSSSKVEKVNRVDSLARIYFVALQDIYPTQVGTIPFTKDGLAIAISNTTVSGTMKNYVKSRFDNSTIQPHYYVMILLHPDRLALQPTEKERPFSKFMFKF